MNHVERELGLQFFCPCHMSGPFPNTPSFFKKIPMQVETWENAQLGGDHLGIGEICIGGREIVLGLV